MAEYQSWVRWMLFASAYAPLWLSMAVENIEITTDIYDFPVPVLSILFLVLVIVSSTVLYFSVEVRQTKEPKYRTVIDYQRKDEILSSYLIAYIVPFVGLDYTAWQSWLILIIFLGMLASIQINSDKLYVNPLLAIMGYQVYEIEYEEHGTSLVVVDKSIQVQQGPMKVTEISHGIYLSTD